VAALAAMLWVITHRPASTMLSADWFRDMLRRLQFTENRLLPSWWLSTGLLEAARDEMADSILFLVLMVSNALFVRLLAVWASARLYRSAYSRLYGRRSGRKRTKTSWIDRAVARAAGVLPDQVQLLIVKDLRLFLRDPVYWSQTLIFVGFLLLYFFSIPSIHYEVAQEAWVNLMSFLNVSVVGFLLSTFTTRFVFPMISLEGRRFWILGLLPVRRDRILWGKFAFGIGVSVISSCVLVLVSDSMLRVEPWIFLGHQLTCLILGVGLSGIAVGLGARMPNLREESPSRIAAGFGGTLTLVLSTLYILAVVLMTAVPCHFCLGAQSPESLTLFRGSDSIGSLARNWLIAGTLGSILLGVVATVVPLVIGFRAFRRLEF
jgi:ABC-2 type transport system permease protein